MLIGFGVGWLVFSKEGQRAVDREVDAVEREIDKGLNEAGKAIEDATQ